MAQQKFISLFWSWLPFSSPCRVYSSCLSHHLSSQFNASFFSRWAFSTQTATSSLKRNLYGTFLLSLFLYFFIFRYRTFSWWILMISQSYLSSNVLCFASPQSLRVCSLTVNTQKKYSHHPTNNSQFLRLDFRNSLLHIHTHKALMISVADLGVEAVPAHSFWWILPHHHQRVSWRRSDAIWK